MTERTLLASIDHQLVGTLHENQNLWAFEYDPAWLANPDRFVLSPHLPLQAEILRDGATRRPAQWYFDNLLPEERVRELTQVEQETDALARERPELRATLGGELKLLRAIRHIVIQEMVARVSGHA